MISPMPGRALPVVADALGRLAAEPSPDAGIRAALAITGRGLAADRVYVFAHGPERDAAGLPRTCGIQYEWTAEGVQPQSGQLGFDCVDLRATLGEDLAELAAGQAVFVRLAAASTELRDLQSSAPAACFLMLPVYVAGAFWGLVGFDWVEVREPSDELRAALRVLSLSIGAVLGAAEGSRLLHAVFSSFQHSAEGLAILDARWRLTHCNAALEHQCGCVPGADLGALLDCWPGGASAGAVKASVLATGRWQGTVQRTDALGERRRCVLSVRRIPDVGFLASFADVTALHASEARLQHQLLHDDLTGLPNRAAFKARLEQALSEERARGGHLGLLFVDLDGFKTVNDSLGHRDGDGLLIAWTRRLAALVGPGDGVFRIGGDEFAVLLAGRTCAADLEHAAGLLLEACRDSYALPSGAAVHATASLGLAVFPVDDAVGGAEAYEGYADAALFRAKGTGRNRVQRYEPAMTRHMRRRLELEGELRVAVEARALEVWLQPQFDVADGRLTGAEALLRWPRANGRFTSPGEFIPVAEETGLIVPITEQVLEMVCAAWRPLSAAAGRPLRLAVNVSPAQFHHHDVTSMLRDALSRFPVPEGGLEVELTESALMLDPDTMRARLGELRALGTRIAIDDFGTGYSSLSALRRYPLDWLKIDRSFVTDLPGDPSALIIADTILAMARALGLRTMAEGVETVEQLEVLKQRGCTGFQGFLRSGAIPIPELLRRLQVDPVAAGFPR